MNPVCKCKSYFLFVNYWWTQLLWNGLWRNLSPCLLYIFTQLRKGCSPLLGFWTLANIFYTFSNLTKFWNWNVLEQENKGGMEAKASLEGRLDLWIVVLRTYTDHIHQCSRSPKKLSTQQWPTTWNLIVNLLWIADLVWNL